MEFLMQSIIIDILTFLSPQQTSKNKNQMKLVLFSEIVLIYTTLYIDIYLIYKKVMNKHDNAGGEWGAGHKQEKCAE